MPHEIHRNSTRGHVRQGWLQSAHSFSFGHYYNPERTNFGALLVVNEDTIQPGTGFGEHGHDNMEIITIPLQGSLVHSDSLGNTSTLHAGDIQIMSAGTGIRHSERNASDTEPLHLLQIWIIPNQQGLPTRYEESTIDQSRLEDAFFVVVAPTPAPGASTIRQEAWFSLGRFTAGRTCTLSLHTPTSGLFLFVIEGEIRIGNDILTAGDAFTATEYTTLDATILHPAYLLAIEVPMLP